MLRKEVTVPDQSAAAHNANQESGREVLKALASYKR